MSGLPRFRLECKEDWACAISSRVLGWKGFRDIIRVWRARHTVHLSLLSFRLPISLCSQHTPRPNIKLHPHGQLHPHKTYSTQYLSTSRQHVLLPSPFLIPSVLCSNSPTAIAPQNGQTSPPRGHQRCHRKPHRPKPHRPLRVIPYSKHGVARLPLLQETDL
jgi:hypothetical protein